MLFLSAYGRNTVLGLLFFWTALGAAAFPIHPALTAVPALGALFTLYFFRDPRRAVPEGEANIVSPADGTITEVAALPSADGIDRPVIKIGIFLSVLDVHVNRAPCAGVVSRIAYRPGRFLNAMSPESSGANEANSLLLATADHGCVGVRQIAGKIARRIVCAVREGDRLIRGQKIGMIKFGSRTELFLERDRVAEVVVKVGDKVKGARSVLARFGERAP
jgi:phosphatidylserine decarboxylase